MWVFSEIVPVNDFCKSCTRVSVGALHEHHLQGLTRPECSSMEGDAAAAAANALLACASGEPAVEVASAEPGEATAPSAAQGESARRGRRAKLTDADDLIIIREVASAKDHIAGFGEKRERYAQAAARANATEKLSVPVTSKSIQDRYTKLQERFDTDDRVESRM